jgi:hypothetical protein
VHIISLLGGWAAGLTSHTLDHTLDIPHTPLETTRRFSLAKRFFFFFLSSRPGSWPRCG